VTDRPTDRYNKNQVKNRKLKLTVITNCHKND